MKRFHVIVEVDRMPLQFDVAEIVNNGDLAFEVRTADHGEILMCFDPELGRYRIKGSADEFWKAIENDLDEKIQFENL